MSIDPLTKKYPFYSPYSFSGNRVIDAVELEGAEPQHVTQKGDTHSSIAKQYGVGVGELRNLNTYKDTEIPIGVAITLTDNNHPTYQEFKSFHDKGAIHSFNTETDKMSNSERLDVMSSNFERMKELDFMPFENEGRASTFIAPISTPGGSDALKGTLMFLRQVTPSPPDYIGVYASGDFIFGVGAGADINYGWIPGEGARAFPELRGGGGFSFLGKGVGIMIGDCKLDVPSFSTIGGPGLYGNGALGLSLGYSNSLYRNGEGKWKRAWDFYTIGIGGIGGSGGVNLSFQKEMFQKEKVKN